MTLRQKHKRKKLIYWTSSKLKKKNCYSEDIVKERKRQVTNSQGVFVKHIIDNGLEYRIYENA